MFGDNGINFASPINQPKKENTTYMPSKPPVISVPETKSETHENNYLDADIKEINPVVQFNRSGPVDLQITDVGVTKYHIPDMPTE